MQVSKYHTSVAMVRADWIASRISIDVVDLNKEAIAEGGAESCGHATRTPITQEAQKNLIDWIEKFVSSFKTERLRQTLQNSYFKREEGFLQTTAGNLEALVIVIRPRIRRNLRFLLSKIEQIRYCIQKLDPDVQFLLIVTPNLRHTTAIDLTSGQSIDLIGNGEVG